MDLGNTVVAAQVALGLVLEILNPVDVIVTLRKLLAMIDPVMPEFRNNAGVGSTPQTPNRPG